MILVYNHASNRQVPLFQQCCMPPKVCPLHTKAIEAGLRRSSWHNIVYVVYSSTALGFCRSFVVSQSAGCNHMVRIVLLGRKTQNCGCFRSAWHLENYCMSAARVCQQWSTQRRPETSLGKFARLLRLASCRCPTCLTSLKICFWGKK